MKRWNSFVRPKKIFPSHLSRCFQLRWRRLSSWLRRAQAQRWTQTLNVTLGGVHNRFGVPISQEDPFAIPNPCRSSLRQVRLQGLRQNDRRHHRGILTLLLYPSRSGCNMPCCSWAFVCTYIYMLTGKTEDSGTVYCPDHPSFQVFGGLAALGSPLAYSAHSLAPPESCRGG